MTDKERMDAWQNALLSQGLERIFVTVPIHRREAIEKMIAEECRVHLERWSRQKQYAAE